MPPAGGLSEIRFFVSATGQNSRCWDAVFGLGWRRSATSESWHRACWWRPPWIMGTVTSIRSNNRHSASLLILAWLYVSMTMPASKPTRHQRG
jgi:hypothetical protein